MRITSLAVTNSPKVNQDCVHNFNVFHSSFEWTSWTFQRFDSPSSSIPSATIPERLNPLSTLFAPGMSSNGVPAQRGRTVAYPCKLTIIISTNWSFLSISYFLRREPLQDASANRPHFLWRQSRSTFTRIVHEGLQAQRECFRWQLSEAFSKWK